MYHNLELNNILIDNVAMCAIYQESPACVASVSVGFLIRERPKCEIFYKLDGQGASNRSTLKMEQRERAQVIFKRNIGKVSL